MRYLLTDHLLLHTTYCTYYVGILTGNCAAPSAQPPDQNRLSIVLSATFQASVAEENRIRPSLAILYTITRSAPGSFSSTRP